tara:strand:+ start:4660 stop:5814 length:1155 start_codon:yes stop_codon:yes gene_type:complete
MFKDISPSDRSIKTFKTYKQFTFTNSDSGSGVYGLEGISGSFHNFLTGSAYSQSYGTFNELSQSQGKAWHTWYSEGTFFKLPLYFQIRNSYYQYDQPNNPKANNTRYPLYAGGNWSRKWPHGREDSSWGTINPRKLESKVNVITIPQEYFGEEIKPRSIKILDDSNGTTLDLRDDGHGQLYDWNYSASFAAGTPGGSPLTGSVVGNVFYEQGIITITDTGSLYISASLGSGSLPAGQYTGDDGFQVEFQATKTSYEYEYMCHIDEFQFTGTTNPSVVVGRSGSIFVPEGAQYIYDGEMRNYVGGVPKYENTIDLVLPPASSSYKMSYNSGKHYQNFTTHSAFGTYVTNIGLYNDERELLAIAKLSNPIKNDKDLPISFLVRFDS